MKCSPELAQTCEEKTLGFILFHRNNNNNDFYLGKGSGFFSLLSLENSAVSRCSLSMFLPAVPFHCFLKALLGLFFSKQHHHSCFWRVDFPAQAFLPQQQASSISSPCKMGIFCPSEIIFCGSFIADFNSDLFFYAALLQNQGQFHDCNLGIAPWSMF